ncbi:MAG: hypothetical protein AAB229_07855, partial [Candidatus Hydrogenedentota bacterium]
GVVTSAGFVMAVPDAPTTFGRELFSYPWLSAPVDVFVEHGAPKLVRRDLGMAPDDLKRTLMEQARLGIDTPSPSAPLVTV